MQPISQIAYAGCFSDHTHFARQFRRRFDHPPGARRENQTAARAETVRCAPVRTRVRPGLTTPGYVLSVAFRMIAISTPLSISSSVRDIERLLRESPPFLRAGRMSKLRSCVATLTMHARKRSIHHNKEASSKRTARQQTECKPLQYFQQSRNYPFAERRGSR